MEDQLDNTLQALDNMDPDDLEAMRQRRLDQMKRAAAQRQEWSRKGHGEYKEIFGERGFFAEMKGEERMVCHFYRENWPCKVGKLSLALNISKSLSHALFRRYKSFSRWLSVVSVQLSPCTPLLTAASCC